MPSLFSFPRKIQVQTINLCNYTCRMCPYPDLSDQKMQRLDRQLFSRIIEDVRSAGRRVDLCLMLQNEPLLDRRFAELLAEAHGASDAVNSISTVTNGSALNEDALRLLMEFPRFGLTVSLNATERLQYQEIHGVDLFEKVTALLENWQGPKDRIRLSYIVNAATMENARQFQEVWRQQNYRTRLVPILSRAGALPISADHRVMFDAGYSYCHYPTDTLNVIADGRVILCCQDWNHATTYGNLNQASIAEIWNSAALVKVREVAIDGRLRAEVGTCRNCDYPMRSAMRVALESELSDRSRTEGEFSIVEHESEIQLNASDTPTRVLICGIDPRAGFLEALISNADPQLAELQNFSKGRLRLGGFEGEALSFGSMAAVWCPISRIDLQPLDQMSAIALRIYLDQTAEEFRLLPWYRAEWEHLQTTASP